MAFMVIAQQLNISLKRTKEIVDAAAANKHDDIVLSQSPDGSYIATIGDALESVGCICKIIEKYIRQFF